jgi:hypothetical protein
MGLCGLVFDVFYLGFADGIIDFGGGKMNRGHWNRNLATVWGALFEFVELLRGVMLLRHPRKR